MSYNLFACSSDASEQEREEAKKLFADGMNGVQVTSSQPNKEKITAIKVRESNLRLDNLCLV